MIVRMTLHTNDTSRTYLVLCCLYFNMFCTMCKLQCIMRLFSIAWWGSNSANKLQYNPKTKLEQTTIPFCLAYCFPCNKHGFWFSGYTSQIWAWTFGSMLPIQIDSFFIRVKKILWTENKFVEITYAFYAAIEMLRLTTTNLATIVTDASRWWKIIPIHDHDRLVRTEEA